MPSTEHRDEQQAPPPPPIHGLRWPGRRDEASGAEQYPTTAAAEQIRAEQYPIRYMSDDEYDAFLDSYLDVTGGWTPGQCFGCENPAVAGKTRCQRCIDETPPQNYEELRERHPNLPVRRPNEARRFA